MPRLSASQTYHYERVSVCKAHLSSVECGAARTEEASLLPISLPDHAFQKGPVWDTVEEDPLGPAPKIVSDAVGLVLSAVR